MKKNKVLPYNRDARAFQGTDRAQSDSSLEIYANCPTNFAYNYGLFAHRTKPELFVWFVYGGVIHKIADAIRTEILIEKTVSNRMSKEAEESYFKKWYYLVRMAMDPEFAHEQKGESQEFIYIPRDSINRMGHAKYKEIADKKLKEYLRKAWNTIKAVYYSTRIETNFTFNKYEWRFSSQKFRVPNLHMPDNPVWILGAFDEINYIADDGGLSYIITDLKSGNKNNLKLQENHQMLMYNHVARNIDHASPSKLYTKETVNGKEVKIENPRMEHLAIFNGLPPRDQFLISLDIEGWALAKHGDNVLYSEDFRLPVDVNYEVEWPEHHRFISDISTEQHYMLKSYDLLGHMNAPADFEPLSKRGKLVDIGRSMREQRFAPRISPKCGLCPAKLMCQEDHPDDWEEYRERHGLGLNFKEENFVFEPTDVAVDVEDDGGMRLPDDEYVRKVFPVQLALDFNGRGQSKHNVLVPKTVTVPKLKEMQALGFMSIKSLMSYVKKCLRQLPFLEGGYKCQCMKFKDLAYLPIVLIFIKYFEGKWSLDFKKEEIHQFMVVHCPLEDCLRRAEHMAKHEDKQAELKESIAKHKEGIITIE